jgi:hypothetical protein
MRTKTLAMDMVFQTYRIQRTGISNILALGMNSNFRYVYATSFFQVFL